MKNFEFDLPAGYELAYHIDARDKKTGTVLTVWAFVLTIAAAVPLCIGADYRALMDDFLLKNILFLAAMCAYIVLHELTHGAAYYLMTK